MKISGNDNTGLFDDRVFALIGAVVADKCLPPPLTEREHAIEARQTDHDVLYTNPNDPYGDFDFDTGIEIEIPFADYDFDTGW